jgi:hypothetical protein
MIKDYLNFHQLCYTQITRADEAASWRGREALPAHIPTIGVWRHQFH